MEEPIGADKKLAARRLTLARGAAWLGSRIASEILYGYLWYQIHEWAICVKWIFLGIVSTAVLRGWRTRPWMAFLAAMLSLGVVELRLNSPSNFYEVWSYAVLSPYAVSLLFGTRLLTPEEREHARAAREPTQ